MHRESVALTTPGRALIEVTVRRSGIRTGLCTVFIQHTRASLILSTIRGWHGLRRRRPMRPEMR